jgi:hypothetical protein
MLMKNRGPFTPEEKVLNDLNFDTYADPIARSIENLDLASRRWATQIAQIPISSGDARKKELNRLGKLKGEYIRAFAGAARTLVEESDIEELAVSAVDVIVRDDEARRRKSLDRWLKGDDKKPPTDGYFHDVVMAFADPTGETVMEQDRLPIFSQAQALLWYTKRINEHEYAAIKEYSPLTVESQPIHAKLGRFAFDSAASAIRGINRFRKAK